MDPLLCIIDALVSGYLTQSLFCFFQMKVYTQNRTQDTLTVPQRFGLGCVSGAVAHAVFYPLEVSEISGRFECFNISVPSSVLA